LITIEDAKELVLDQHPNHVRLFYSKDDQGQAKVSPRQLLESCLRMKPDRILLAELRADEAFDYLRNVNSGHPGSITSVHAASAELAFEQLVLLVKQSRAGRSSRVRTSRVCSICSSISLSSSASIGMNALSKRSGMTPLESAAPWQPTVSQTRRRSALRIAGVTAVLLLVGAYLAGYVFLWSFGFNPREATPLTIFRYGYYFGDREAVRRRLLLSGAAGGAMVVASALAIVIPRRRPLHGDARYTTRRELAAAGLLGSQGIILGRVGRRCLMLAGQQGLALAAPPRAGKGTGVVIPNLLNWPDSVICVDIKRENWTLTSGFRAAHGQSCFLFDPSRKTGAPRAGTRFTTYRKTRSSASTICNGSPRCCIRIHRMWIPSGPQVRAPCSWGSLYISSRPHRCRRPS